MATDVAVSETHVYVVGNVADALPGQKNEGGTDAFVRKYDLGPGGIRA